MSKIGLDIHQRLSATTGACHLKLNILHNFCQYFKSLLVVINEIIICFRFSKDSCTS